MPSKTPRDTIKVRSRFKVGQEVWIKAKITKIRESWDKSDPELVLDSSALIVHSPLRVHESNAVPAATDED